MTDEKRVRLDAATVRNKQHQIEMVLAGRHAFGFWQHDFCPTVTVGRPHSSQAVAKGNRKTARNFHAGVATINS